MRRWIVLTGVALAVVLVVLVARALDPGREQDQETNSTHGEPPKRDPNIVVIVTNDQRWDTLWALPSVQRTLVRRGALFENAFVVNPSCCPSRSSILTGLYSHSTGVFRNHPPYGGFEAFDDGSTLPIWLQEDGYETALLGEYLNGYRGTKYIPPGWDRWFAFGQRMDRATKAYYDFEINADGKIEAFGGEPDDYSTDVLANEAVRFIATARSPFFLFFSPAAPHTPAIPPPRYSDEFDDLGRWRPPSYDEPDDSDKPPWLQALGGIDAYGRAQLDEFRQNQYRSLLAIDDAVARIVDALRRSDQLADTVLLFLSDHGYLWGEHGIDGKGVPYEESIRIPLVMRYDRLMSTRLRLDDLVLNIDLAPTITELAGIDAPRMEGKSLVPLVTGDGGWRRHDFLIDHLGSEHVPTFCALRTTRSMYAAYSDGSEELYFLREDPFELENRIHDAPVSLVGRLRTRLTELCDPPPPGYGGVPHPDDR